MNKIVVQKSESEFDVKSGQKMFLLSRQSSVPLAAVLLTGALLSGGCAQAQNTNGAKTEANAQQVQLSTTSSTPIYQLEAAKLDEAITKFNGGQAVGEYKLPDGWSFNLWDGSAKGEFAIAKEAKSGDKAIVLRTVSGQPSAQFFNWKKPPLSEGNTYEVVVTYAIADAKGVLKVSGKGLKATEMPLPATDGNWKTTSYKWKQTDSGELELNLQNNDGLGAGKALYIKSIVVNDLGGPSADEVLRGGAVPQQPDGYHAALIKELANKQKLPRGISLLGATEDSVLKKFHLHGPAADAGTLKIIDVQGQPFKKALRMDINRLPGEFWHTMLQALSPLPVKKGDIMLVTLYARGGVPNVAGSPALTGVSIKPIPGDPHGFATRDLVLSDQWEKIQMPVEVKEDRVGGKVEWISALSAKIQWMEFGGISVINYGPAVKLVDLPDTSKVSRTYVGREPNAAWRKEALARIEKIRKGNLRVLVTDAAGKPVPNADVKINMTRHAFRWGTAIVPSIEVEPIPDWNKAAHEAQFKHIFNLFNHIAVDIDLKFDRWYGASDEQKAQVIKGLQMFKDRGMTIHGHTMIWPSFTNMPQAAKFKDDPAKLQAELLAHIRELGARTAPFTQTWDVVNEPYGNQEITRIVGGTDAMVEWYREARKVLPKETRLYINEGFTPGSGRATEAYYYDVCRELVQKGAPLEGIGLQSHVGGSPTDIAKMWAGMNKFAALKPGMKLGITEFDVNFRGDVELEGDFTRDYTILAFSHPAVEMFSMWGFHDPYHWLKYAPLFNADGTLKPSGKAWMDLVHKAWITKANGKANAKGEYSTRGFLGDYDITVTANGKTTTVKTSLPSNGKALTVKLP